MKKFLFLLFLLCANTTFAQSEKVEFPFDTMGLPKTFIETPKVGNTYAFVYLPDIYETPDGQRYEVFTKKKKNTPDFPQAYETIKLWYNLPPRLEQKPNISLPKGTKLLDPIYKPKQYQEQVVPASTRWVKRNGGDMNVSYNLDFAHIFSIVEVPAQYQTILTQYDEIQPARKVIGNDTTVLDSASLFHYYWEVHEKKQLTYKKPIQNKEIKIIAYTDTFYYKTSLPKDAVLIKKGKPSKWQQVFSSPHTPTLIIEIQEVLAKKGYYKSEIDNVLGKKTKAALIQFQKDNNLPVGFMDRKTLDTLDIPALKKHPFYRQIQWEE